MDTAIECISNICCVYKYDLFWMLEKCFRKMDAALLFGLRPQTINWRHITHFSTFSENLWENFGQGRRDNDLLTTATTFSSVWRHITNLMKQNSCLRLFSHFTYSVSQHTPGVKHTHIVTDTQSHTVLMHKQAHACNGIPTLGAHYKTELFLSTSPPTRMTSSFVCGKNSQRRPLT